MNNEDEDQSKRIFVGGIPPDATNQQIWDFFGACGEIFEIHRPASLRGGYRWFCFISFLDEQSVKAACELNGHSFPGAPRPLAIAPATKHIRR